MISRGALGCSECLRRGGATRPAKTTGPVSFSRRLLVISSHASMPQSSELALRLAASSHIDMDAFYASVEQRDDPALRGFQLLLAAQARAVWWLPRVTRRANLGVHSAMSSVTARRKCPELVFVSPRFDVYRAGVAADPRHLRTLHVGHSTAVVGRGLSRRDSAFSGSRIGGLRLPKKSGHASARRRV